MDREAVREVFLPRWEDCLEYLRKKRWKEGDQKSGRMATPVKVLESMSVVGVGGILTI